MDNTILAELFPLGLIVVSVIGYFAVKNDWKIVKFF